MAKKPFYITTTLPYVNADPHIGFAMELIRADIIARYKSSIGLDVFLNTGTDEHGMKIYRKAKEGGIEIQEYVNGFAHKFKQLISALGIIKEANFIRTTDEHHIMAAQEFWKIAKKNGYIYKKNYSVKYCIGCELEKTESELVDGKCPLHPLQELENIEEENYFFKFSAFEQKLLELYEKNKGLVIPDFRLKEIKTFVEAGLEDFSISRLKEKMPWGIEVPDDSKHVMYVWFDALVNYISAIGWPDKIDDFEKWWIESGGVVQYCGKDNLRQQSAMWQAMLMAAGLKSSKNIIIDGFITGEGGVKMSKSLGNTVDPFEIVQEYGTDSLRYYVARELCPFEDSPFSKEKFKLAYNSHLANGLGNLISRIMKMAVTYDIKFDNKVSENILASKEVAELHQKQIQGFDKYDIQQAANAVWEFISNTDRIVQDREPFKKIKVNEKEAREDVKELLARIYIISTMLEPILPETAEIIRGLVENNKMPDKPLFMRK